MRDVMMKAQALAEAILASETYQKMHALEEQVTKDPEATAAISAYMEKRGEVEKVLHAPDMDPEKLAEAAQILEKVEAEMDACPMVRDMREAQQKFQEMMDNVNRILRLVVTGEVESSGCTGNCASCGGCGGN